MHIIQIGAGKIGRGLLSQLYFEGGHDIVYIDKDSELVDRLNRQQQYTLRLTTKDDVQDIAISRFHAIHTGDIEAIQNAFTTADMAAVSVGVHELQNVAETLSIGIETRAKVGQNPLDIYIAENQIHSAPLLQGYIVPTLTPAVMRYFFSSIGLVEAVIGRMAPIPPADIHKTDPLLIITEQYKDLPCAKPQMLNPLPPIPGFIAVDNIEAYECRKLFIHNAIHAAIAYLGYGHYTYIWECMEDAQIVETARGIVDESSQALAKAYGFAIEELHQYSNDILYRMRNRHLPDTIARVAADPIRKLRKNDRLIGAALLCMEHDIKPVQLVKAIKSALAYDAPNDPAAIQMQEVIKVKGITGFLSLYCGQPEDSILSRLLIS